MRRLFLYGMLLLCPLPLQAQDGESDISALAEAYQKRCLDSAYVDLSLETQTLFCTCSAAAAMTALSPGDLEALVTGRPISLTADQLDLKIMAPCLSIPLGEMAEKDCLTSEIYRRLFKTQPAYDKMCACVRTGAESFIEEYGLDLAAYVMKRYPYSKSDLAGTISDSLSYKEELAKKTEECLNSHAYQ